MVWAWGELEADFRRFYHLDLNRMVWLEECSYRLLTTLVRHLPPDSAWAGFLRDKGRRSLSDVGAEGRL